MRLLIEILLAWVVPAVAFMRFYYYSLTKSGIMDGFGWFMTIFTGVAFGFVTFLLYCWIYSKTPKGKQGLEKVQRDMEKVRQEHSAQLQQAMQYAVMDNSKKWRDDTLILKKRDKSLKMILHIEQAMNHSMTFHPEKYIGTAATSGGFTVGSVSKIDAHYTLNSKGAGKYKLIYEAILEGKKINNNIEAITIENPNDLEEAKRNPTIAKYIKGNQIIMFSDTNDFLERQIAKSAYGPADPKMNDVMYLRNMRRLSKQDCSAVLDWLAGEL